MFSIKTLILFGLLLILRFFSSNQRVPDYKDGQVLSFEATLFQEPKVIGRDQSFSANLPHGGEILIKTYRFPEFHYADTVRISGPVKFYRSPSGTIRTRLTEQLNGAGIKLSNQSERMLTKEKVALTMFFPKIELIKNDKNLLSYSFKSLLAVTSSVRQKLILIFQKSLPANLSSLLLGIVFGIRESMPKEFTNSLRVSGVMHVVAASGMNITMTGGFLSSLLALFLKRQLALFLAIIGICLYAVLAGLEPSIIRASIMGSMVFSAQILGRQALPFYFLLIAGYLMLFISPNLISDIGFQLSFVSTLGLLCLKPLFEGNKTKEIKDKMAVKNRFVVIEDLTTTISAQAATLPILIANFGTYSLWSILINGLVLWTIPILMVLGGIGAILGILFEPVGRIFIYLSLPFLLYFEKTVTLFSSWGGVINIQEFPWQFTVSYYSLLGAILIWYYNKKSSR